MFFPDDSIGKLVRVFQKKTYWVTETSDWKLPECIGVQCLAQILVVRFLVQRCGWVICLQWVWSQIMQKNEIVIIITVLDMGNSLGCISKVLFRDADFFLCAQLRCCRIQLQDWEAAVILWPASGDIWMKPVQDSIRMDFQVSHICGCQVFLINQVKHRCTKGETKGCVPEQNQVMLQTAPTGRNCNLAIQKAAWYLDLKQFQVSEEASSWSKLLVVSFLYFGWYFSST